jgi:hypothetical protein
MTAQSRSILAATVVAILLLFSAPALAQHKTTKECNAEWSARKTELQASGTTKKAFMSECRGATAATQSGTTQPPPAGAAPGTPAKRAAVGTAAGAGEFATEAQAKAHCPGDTIVWANLNSKVYHFAGTHSYGNTKKGAYMCEKDTGAAGFHAAKNEKHP